MFGSACHITAPHLRYQRHNSSEWQERSADNSIAQIAALIGTNAPAYTRDRPGLNLFVHDGGVVYHTYSTESRGVDGLWGMYQWLDRTPLGRDETGVWWSHHDQYAKPRTARCMIRAPP